LLVPWVYSLWFCYFLYIILLLFGVWQVLPTSSKNPDLEHIGGLWILASIFEALWTPAFQYQVFWLSTLLISTSLIFLLLLVWRIRHSNELFKIAFTLWTGWIMYTTLISATLTLFYTFKISFFGTSIWSIFSIICGVSISFILREIGFSLSLAWVFLGIFIGNSSIEESITAIISIGSILLGTSIIKAIEYRKQQTMKIMNSQPSWLVHWQPVPLDAPRNYVLISNQPHSPNHLSSHSPSDDWK